MGAGRARGGMGDGGRHDYESSLFDLRKTCYTSSISEAFLLIVGMNAKFIFICSTSEKTAPANLIIICSTCGKPVILPNISEAYIPTNSTVATSVWLKDK